jgi:hypothetical protein
MLDKTTPAYKARGCLFHAAVSLTRVLSAFEGYRGFYRAAGQRPPLDAGTLAEAVFQVAELIYTELGPADYARTGLPRPSEIILNARADAT